jgi:hypothetical protein
MQIGIVFPLQNEQVYILKHASASQVALCHVISLEFTGNTRTRDD